MLGFFSSIGGGVLGKFMKLMCVPYTIPLGIINQYVFPIDICYSEKKQDLTYEGNTEESSVQGGSIGTQQNDLNNVSQFSSVNRNVMRILENNKQISSINIDTQNTADISCDFDKREGDEDYKNMYKTANTWRKHKGIDFSAYHCCPKVNQTETIKIVQINQMTSQQINQIKNEINVHVENTLKEAGVGEVNMDAGVKSNNEIQVQSLSSGQGYFSNNAQELYFGLGEKNIVEHIEIIWPSGIIDSFESISSNQTIYVVENEQLYQNTLTIR